MDEFAEQQEAFKHICEDKEVSDLLFKEVSKKAMKILLDEADRLIDAHCAVMPYQLLLASPAMIEGEIKISKKNDRSESI